MACAQRLAARAAWLTTCVLPILPVLLVSIIGPCPDPVTLSITLCLFMPLPRYKEATVALAAGSRSAARRGSRVIKKYPFRALICQPEGSAALRIRL